MLVNRGETIMLIKIKVREQLVIANKTKKFFNTLCKAAAISNVPTICDEKIINNVSFIEI